MNMKEIEKNNYQEMKQKADELFTMMMNSDPPIEYVPPEPESVIKFYEELYRKYGETEGVCDV